MIFIGAANFDAALEQNNFHFKLIVSKVKQVNLSTIFTLKWDQFKMFKFNFVLFCLNKISFYFKY